LLKKQPFNTATLLIILVIIFVFIVPSCIKKSPTPAYLHIPAFAFTTNKLLQGSASNYITEAWVYVNKQPIGAYQLPCTIPIIADGITNLLVLPGIRVNGIIESRKDYPFYKSFEINKQLTPLKTDTIFPSSTYIDSIEFKMKEDFENGTTFKKLFGDTTLIRSTTAGNVFEGAYSGVISFSNENDTVELISINNYNFLVGQPNYLEMDYKNDVALTIGLQANYSQTTTKYWAITLNPKTDWHKVYIELSDPINGLQATSYQLLLRCGSQNNANAKVMVDNLKWITRK
jgi:hypothetical protein